MSFAVFRNARISPVPTMASQSTLRAISANPSMLSQQTLHRNIHTSTSTSLERLSRKGAQSSSRPLGLASSSITNASLASSNFQRRFFSDSVTDPGYEGKVQKMLEEHFGEGSKVLVKDVSGGCGSSFEVHVNSSKFEGKSRLQKERMVQAPIRGEISKWHAVTIRAKLPGEE